MSAPDMPVSSAALLGFVAVVSGVLVVDVAARFFAWRSQSRKLKHLEMTIDELRLELRHVRSELGTIRTGNYTSDNSKLLNHVLDEGPPIERHVSFVPTGASSPSSMSDYFDVRDDWSPMSTEAGPPGDLMPLLADHSEAAAQAPSSLRGSSSSVVIQSGNFDVFSVFVFFPEQVQHDAVSIRLIDPIRSPFSEETRGGHWRWEGTAGYVQPLSRFARQSVCVFRFSLSTFWYCCVSPPPWPVPTDNQQTWPIQSIVITAFCDSIRGADRAFLQFMHISRHVPVS
uniref:Regulator of microtubule dynamics protein 1 n=1 Tax=Panagrellus redivivus TaxID=6233 RepID=A0A7E4V1B0_PANRE